MADRISADDFFAGLFAALSLRGMRTLSIRADQFDPLMAHIFDRLVQRSPAESVDVRFRIRPHPIHGDSLTIQNALAGAAQRDIISFDNPEYQDIRIKLAPDEAGRILANLPGPAQMYQDLADEFVQDYSGPVRRLIKA